MIRLTVVGDVLLDRDWSGTVHRVSPDAPVPVVEGLAERSRAGGAGLAATLAAGQGASVTLVTALGTDAAADELRRMLDDAGVEVVDLGLDGPTPEKLRVRAADQSLVRVDRGCDPMVPRRGPGPVRPTARWPARTRCWSSDYGRGVAARVRDEPALRDAGRGRVGPPPPRAGPAARAWPR